MKNILIKSCLFLLLFCGFAGCSDANNQLLDKLKDAVVSDEKNAQGYTVVDMVQLTDFEWETLYVFHQNDDKNYISRELGFKWEGSAVPNLHRRLLFVNDGKVVSFVDYDFREFPLVVYGCGEDRWVYPRSRAKFATFKYCAGEDITRPFIPVACIADFKGMLGSECPEEAAAE